MNRQKEKKWLKMAINKLHRNVCSQFGIHINFDYALNKASEYTLRCDHLGLNSRPTIKQLDQIKNICWYYLLKEERNETN